MGEGCSQTNSRPCKRSPAADVGCEYTPNRCLPTSSRPVNVVQSPIRTHSGDLGISAPQSRTQRLQRLSEELYAPQFFSLDVVSAAGGI